MLAAFVYPGLFYAGAAAATIPVLIHLLARRRFRRIRWAAIEFLIDAEKRNRRRILLEQIILLTLRCLAILLISLVISRPFVQPRGWTAILGGPQRTERIFLLDDSYSMGYGAGPETCFESAKQNLTRLLAWVQRNSPGDSVTVLRTSEPDVPLAAGVYLDEASATELSERIEALRPSQRTLQLDQAVQTIRRTLDENPGILSATLFVISDFQRVDWVESTAREDTSEARADEAVESVDFGSLFEDGRSLDVVLVAVGDQEASNRSLAGLSPAQGRFVAGIAGRIEAVVANQADAQADQLELQVSVGPLPAQAATIPTISARQTAVVPLDVSFAASGFEEIRVELPPDGLPVDDSRVEVVKVDDSLRLLVVNGEPSADAYLDEVHLLNAALRPAGPVFSGNSIQTADELELETAELSDFHAVILANTYRLSDPAVERLEAFVRGGGGLLIFLGDQVDPEAYNDALHAEGAGLLPVALSEIVQAPPGGVALAEGDYLHPVVRVFGGRDNPFRSNIAVNRFFGVQQGDEPPEDAPATAAVVPRIVAFLGDAERSPAIVEKRFGAGRVMLVTTSCDLEWNNWAKDPSYVVAMLETVQYIARHTATSEDRLVGEPIEIAIDPARHEPEAALRTPAYPAEREIGLSAVPAADGTGLVLRWEATHSAGVYRFVLRNRNGFDEQRLAAVNLDPREGDLTVAGEQDLRRVLPQVSFQYVTSAEELDELGAAGRKELWPGFLVAALLVLLGEQGLAFVFGRKS